MTSVQEIITAVKGLSDAEKAEFLARLNELDLEDAWDRQIEADAKAGRLDHLFARAEADIKAGRTKPLEEFLSETS